MAGRVLVAYASKSGWTAEVAARLGDYLRARGADVTVAPVQDISGVGDYAALVVGSGVRVGGWLPEALAFLSRHQAELRGKPTALFTVHLLATEDTPESATKRRAYAAKARALVTPVAEACFAGGLALERLGLLERLLTRAVKAPEGDFRDWAQVEAWAEVVLHHVSP